MAVSYSVFEGYNKESFDALQAPDFIALQANHPTLLLDSCSTLNLLADESLLDNIHEVEHTMHVKCNAGVTSTNLMGRFGDFPDEPVWYNPNGVPNILSLYIMTKYYRVTMDTNKDNAMLVWKKDGLALRFALVGKGLYACTNLLKNDTSRWALIKTQ
jgi:hypothetical protein